jgi:hypothetical protein
MPGLHKRLQIRVLATYTGGIDSLESISGLLISLKIRALAPSRPSRPVWCDERFSVFKELFKIVSYSTMPTTLLNLVETTTFIGREHTEVKFLVSEV